MTNWAKLLNEYNQIKQEYNDNGLTNDDDYLTEKGEKIKEGVKNVFVNMFDNKNFAKEYLKAIKYDENKNQTLTAGVSMLDLMENTIVLSAMFNGQYYETIYGIIACNFADGFEVQNYIDNKVIECASIAKLAKKEYSQKERIEKMYKKEIEEFVSRYKSKTIEEK